MLPREESGPRLDSQQLSCSIVNVEFLLTGTLVREVSCNWSETKKMWNFFFQLALGLAFVAGKGNRNQEPKPENLEETVAKTTIPNIGFSVDTAKKCDANLVLPSQRYFKISEALKPGEIGGATSSKFVSHTRKLARKMFDKIDKVNDLMICYAATSSSTSKKYNVINDQFFIKLADFFIHGFGQKPTGDRREFVKNLLVEVMHNKLNRIRNRYNQEKGANKSEEAGKWMQMELKKENCGELVRTRLQLPSASNDVWDDEDVENDAFETPVREEYRREKENEHPRSVEPEEPDDMMD
ncbi:SPK domain-containing protein [Caenorhabditis elegans]|uniref:SPK domain-containing protein n=1 Tax=Caenorhabditis elegans TaxID=6239 RepID=Q22779_CAEEL|nr:SPK domain-containing protein [Caenorhabditis elegans]CCD72693.3 SPK domain-containing protein [Caenorhabditis elegans]